MTGILIKKENLDIRDMHIERMTCDNEGVDQDDASTGQRIAKIASKPPKVRESSGTSLLALRGSQFCPHLLATRTDRH